MLGNSTGNYKMIGGSAVSGATVTRTDANTTGNNIVLSSVAGVAIGQAIAGAGIPAGTFITNVNPASNTVTLSQSVSATASGNYATAATGYAGTIVAGSGQSELFFHNLTGTLGINAVIADNSGLPLNVIFSSINGSTFELFNTNSYTGTTYVNSSILSLRNPNGAAIPGNLVITGGANSGGYNLHYTQAVARLQYNQQVGSILAPVDVTVRGTAFFDLNGYTQTVNNLILQQPGGSNGNIGAQVGTGVGALTILGQISSNNILAINGVPTINGFIDQKGNGLTVDVTAPASMPLQIALALNTTLQNTTALTKTGTGVLGVGGRSLTFAGPINVNQGTLAISASGAFLGQGSALVLNESQVKTALDLRGIGSVTVGSGQGSAFIGSLAGTGTLTNFHPTAGATLATGLDNSNTAFTGTITNPFVGGLLSLNKVGTGAFTLGGDSIAAGGNSPNLGTLNVQVGGVTLGGYGRASFSTTNVLAGASLVLDSSLVARNNRLGGTFLLGSAAVAAPVSLAGNTYSNATLNVADSTGLFAGMTVTGPGIATGTTIATILGTTLTLSANAATSVAGGTFNFGTARTLNLAGGRFPSSATIAPRSSNPRVRSA